MWPRLTDAERLEQIEKLYWLVIVLFVLTVGTAGALQTLHDAVAGPPPEPPPTHRPLRS